MLQVGGLCRIAAVVPTYNRRHLLERCLLSLLRQTRALDEIFVIDNASTDDTAGMLQREFFGKVTLVHLSENSGSAGGFREGIYRACERGHDWIWVMDNDAQPAPDALQALTDSPKFKDPQVGLLGSLVISADLRVQASHHLKLTGLMKEVPATRETCPSELSVRLDAKSYTGSLIRRTVIETIGLPNQELFAYYDDLDYCCRIRQQFNLFLIPASRVIHADGKITSRTGLLRYCSERTPFEQRWKTFYTLRNKTFFMTRYAKVWALPAVFLKTAISAARGVCGAIAFDDHKARRTALILRAWRDGLLGRLGKLKDVP